MSIVQTFQNPFERLTLLPTAMNYIGEWQNSVQYFRNDVVEDFTDQSFYILTGITVITGGATPSTNPLWTRVLSVNNDGVQSVTQGTGITVDNTVPTQPIISNSGVVTLATQTNFMGLGLQNQSPLAPFPLIVNTGVNEIIPSAGITLIGNTLSSSGLVGLQSGTGTVVTGTGRVTVSNSGIITVSAGDLVQITGTQQNPIISAIGPSLSLVVPSVASMIPLVIPDSNTLGLIAPISSVGQFATYMNIGGPDGLDGTFLLDFSAWSWRYVFSVPNNAFIFLSLVDTTSVPPVTYQIPYTLYSTFSGAGRTLAGGVVPVSLSAARAAGIRFVNAISVRMAATLFNGTPTFTLNTSGPVYATFVPLVL